MIITKQNSVRMAQEMCLCEYKLMEITNTRVVSATVQTSVDYYLCRQNVLFAFYIAVDIISCYCHRQMYVYPIF